MNIGQKIKELRVAKMMTQADLAGEMITRNMLSAIENGTAQPSLGTLLYLASRLGIPAGFLLAEEGDEALYRKMNALSDIKRAYAAGDYLSCRRVSLDAAPEPDDELSLLLSLCDLNLGKEAFEEGRLRAACRLFDESLEYASRSAYAPKHVFAEATVYFTYMERVSPTLYSEVLDAGRETEFSWNSPFAAYVGALGAVDKGDDGAVSAYLSSAEEGFFKRHIEILCQMKNDNYDKAQVGLRALLQGGELKSSVQLYEVLSALEVCCRESEDYKGAYEYATEKVHLAEELLSESKE